MKTPISPKILAGANAAALIALFITLLGALGPGSLDFLGHWAPLAYSVVAILTFAGAAYLKTDSLREAGLAAMQKAAEEAAAAIEASKQTSITATAVNDPAPATVFPAAKVDAALAAPEPAIEPVTVTPILPSTPAA